MLLQVACDECARLSVGPPLSEGGGVGRFSIRVLSWGSFQRPLEYVSIGSLLSVLSLASFNQLAVVTPRDGSSALILHKRGVRHSRQPSYRSGYKKNNRMALLHRTKVETIRSR